VDDFRKLVSDDDPILHAHVAPFEFDQKKPCARDVERFLTNALLYHAAQGIAANQMGLPYRVFTMLYYSEPLVCFNPLITELSPECVTMSEGCLSFPDKELSIRRPKTCRLNYSDSKGERHSLLLDGIHARCALHETDHLNGIVFTSKATAPSFIFKCHVSPRKKRLTRIELW
jgi:peptide deformylase